MKILFCIPCLVIGRRRGWQCRKKRVDGFARHRPAFRIQSTINKSGTLIFRIKFIHHGLDAPFLSQVHLCQVIYKVQSGVVESFPGGYHNIPTSGPAIEHSDHLALFVAAADPHTMYIFYNQRFIIEFVLQNLFNDNNACCVA